MKNMIDNNESDLEVIHDIIDTIDYSKRAQNPVDLLYIFQHCRITLLKLNLISDLLGQMSLKENTSNKITEIIDRNQSLTNELKEDLVKQVEESTCMAIN